MGSIDPLPSRSASLGTGKPESQRKLLGVVLLVGLALGFGAATIRSRRERAPEATRPAASAPHRPPPPPFRAATFERIYRDGKLIEASFSIGVTKNRFFELFQEFAAEFAIVEPAVKAESERRVLTGYLEAYSDLSDLSVVWKEEEARIPIAGVGIAIEGSMFPGKPALLWWVSPGESEHRKLARRYQLKDVDGQSPDSDLGHAFIVGDAHRVIMAAASERLQSAATSYEAASR
jgi:hypothetical protein